MNGHRFTSLILAAATQYLLPLLLFLSVDILLRGHNKPGGGFMGGIMAASALALYFLAHDAGSVRRILRVHPRHFFAMGLLTAAVSGLIPLFFGKPFMTGVWWDRSLPVIGKVGTPLLFDIGVYHVVVGIILTIFLTLMEDR
jgi:multicomponent Na+:H+ antiporter subunit B